MEIKAYPPNPALREFVESILIFSVQTDRGSLLPVNPFPPVPQQSLFFYLRDPIQTGLHGSSHLVTSPPCLVVGPQLTRVNIRMGHEHLLLHVGFKPGGLHRLIGVPMHELVDTGFCAADLLGKEADQVHEQLRNTSDWQQMVNVVERFLVKKLTAQTYKDPFDLAMAQVLRSKGNVPVEQLAATACLSLKQFERKCKQRIGLPPKLFSRLTRFSHAYRLKEANPDINWTDISYACGYFDQMHLIRDFKDFAGVTPLSLSKELQKTPYRLQANIQL